MAGAVAGGQAVARGGAGQGSSTMAAWSPVISCPALSALPS
ncbi:hypothetical protein FM106_17730 [Brachybacterium faecium]|nr:hypothetical protein FM106_17730 [Brachybacterium faecium]